MNHGYRIILGFQINRVCTKNLYILVTYYGFVESVFQYNTAQMCLDQDKYMDNPKRNQPG